MIKNLVDSSREREVDEPVSIVLQPSASDEALLRRVRGEFRQIPSLRLTLEQAMRLWDLDRPTCCRVLERLVASRFLKQDVNGRYARAHAGH